MKGKASIVYETEGPEQVLAFDVFLPYRWWKKWRLRKLLDDLFEDDVIARSAVVQQADPPARAQIISSIRNMVQGYTLTKVRGAFKSEKGLDKDSSYQVRIIVKLGAPAVPTLAQSTLDPVIATAKMQMWAIVKELIIRPYVASVNPELEFWMLESSATLHRWSRLDA